jgi:hypothetical protein
MLYQWVVDIPSMEGSFVKSVTLDSFLNQAKSENDALRRRQLAIVWTSLLGDSSWDVKPRRVISRFLHWISTDQDEAIRFCGDLAQKLLTLCERAPGGEIILTDDLGPLFRRTPLYREWRCFEKDPEPNLFKYIYSFLVFPKKLYVTRNELKPAALRSWYETEKRISAIDFGTPLVESLRNVMAFLTEGYDKFVLYPQHGSGAVAEEGKKGIFWKSQIMKLTPGLRYILEDRMGIFDLGPENICPFGELPRDDGEASSRLAFVPKSWKAMRSICMEPAALQWAQQGVFDWIRWNLKRSVLGEYVVLDDQSHNRLLSQEGSRTSVYDTIDLSSASDSVAWSLVKAIFPTRLLLPLQATRSTGVLIPMISKSRPVFPHKFAPMGSAVCFPVQCYVFSSVVIAAGIYEVLGLDPTEDVLTPDQVRRGFIAFSNGEWIGALGTFKVFGDDIICNKTITSSVISMLVSLGFRVNEEKSFRDSQCFRESCGGHYFLGHDVTPFMWSFKSDLSHGLEPDGLASLIAAANRAHTYGYDCTRRAIIAQCRYLPLSGREQSTKPNPVLFTQDRTKSWAIWSDNPRNDHLERCSYRDDRAPMELINQQRDGCRRIVGKPVNDPKLRERSRSLAPYHLTRWWRKSACYRTQVDLSDGADSPQNATRRRVRTHRERFRMVAESILNEASATGDNSPSGAPLSAVAMRWAMEWEPIT